MQATKTQTSGGKKCKNTADEFQQQQQRPNKMLAPGTSMSESLDDIKNNKSVAQRVMDVTSNNNINQGKVSQNSSSNSVENDQEVEDITNRASRLEVAATNLSSNEKTDQHHHHHHIRHHNQLIEVVADTNNQSTSSTTTTNTTTTTTTALTTTTTSSSSTSLSSSAAAANKQPKAPDSPKLMLDELPLATPDSANNNEQVPATNKAGGRHTFSNHSSSITSLSDGLPVTCESVVFRQQQQQQQIVMNKGSMNQSAGGLIMESNRPKIDNQIDHRQQGMEKRILLDTKVPHPLDSQVDFGFSCPQEEAATSCKHLQRQQHQLLEQQQQQQQQQQHLHQLQHRHSAGEHHQFTSHHSRQSSSRDYMNDVDDEDYDECDPRYHNASVEKRSQKQFLAQNNELANDYNNTDDHHEPGNHNHHQSRITTGANSTPTSPKAKSAPATPCNVTPIAFHQHNSQLNATANPSSANTLPLDIRKNISATLNPIDLQYLDELLKRGEHAFEGKNYPDAIRSFSQCIELAKNNLPENSNLAYLKRNFKVYGHRAEAYFILNRFNEAIEDSMAARDLNPKWTKAYRLQGQAQFQLGQHADSLAAFSFGLAQDPSNGELFDVLVQSALQSSFKQDFEPEYKKLKSLELDKKPFVVVSVLGQELLAKGHGKHAAIILESALKMNLDNNNTTTNNKKFKASVLSTIAVAYCLIKDHDRAITYMLKELELVNELEDVNGQCRVLSNLGYTYYKLRKFDNSLEEHRKQLNIALKTNLFHQASMALNAIGHVHSARNDYSNALTSHTRCLDLLRQLCDNDYSQFKELLAIGHIHSMLNDLKAAEERYSEAIVLLKQCKISPDDFYVGLIMVKFNLAYLALKRQAYQEAIKFYTEIMELSQRITQPRWGWVYDMRASNGLGQTYRLLRDISSARRCFERQLQLARGLEDVSGQSQALANLGMTCQHFKEYKKSWNYFKDNLELVDKQGGGADKLLKGYALSYMASIYFMDGRVGEAQAHYENSASLFEELQYCSAERKTIELNMGFVQERAGQPELNSSSSFNHHQRKVILAPQ